MQKMWKKQKTEGEHAAGHILYAADDWNTGETGKWGAQAKARMRKRNRTNRRVNVLLAGIQILLGCLLAGILLVGCSKMKEDAGAGEKVRDLEFTVVEREAIPEELATRIAEKEKTPFKLTYNDGQSLYVAVGYGEQETGGYSIQVKSFYLGENAIYIDTELIGPSKEEQKGTEKSSPYIVVKTEFLEEPVVFQ